MFEDVRIGMKTSSSLLSNPFHFFDGGSALVKEDVMLYAWQTPLDMIIFSSVLRDSTPRFVGPLVTLYFFGVFAVFGLTAPA